MKKLLLVLVVVTLASFLLVGCLPGVVVDDDDDDGDDGGVVEAAIAFDKEYTNASGVTFIACGDTVTVTLPTPAPEDYLVYVAVKDELDCDPEDCNPYDCEEALTPNADRTVWTGTFAPTVGLEACVEECEPFCVVALLKHPCCAGEEIALRVVTPDCIAPPIPDFTFLCLSCNPCETVCEPEGATFSFTTMGAGDDCNVGVDSCDDNCSGVGEWSFMVGGVCDPCTLATGTGCPVEGTAACGCLPWQTAAERLATPDVDKTYTIVFTIADNVGNESEATYYITVDTDEVVLCLDEEPME